MARGTKPFAVRPHHGQAWIDFYFGGKRIREALGVPLRAERSSQAEARAAEEAAARHYAKFVEGRRVTPGARVITAATLDELVAVWLDAIETPANKGSIRTRTIYGRHWSHFADDDPEGKRWAGDGRTPLERLTSDAGPMQYAIARLHCVLRKTVRKELTSLFAFLEWCMANGRLASIPPHPKLPRGEPGKRSGTQRSSPVKITEIDARAIIDALPEWSRTLPDDEVKVARMIRKNGRPFRVRDVFDFAWETALRPSTIERIEVPRNYYRGSVELVLDHADDKARYGRSVPLSARARAILDRIVPERGLIFGAHDYTTHLKVAALKVLPKEKAKAFAAYDFRHGRATHLLDVSGNLLGVAYLMGHKQLTTTNAYLAASDRHARAVIDSLPRGDGGPMVTKPSPASSSPTEILSDFESGRVDSNHRPLDPQRTYAHEITGDCAEYGVSSEIDGSLKKAPSGGGGQSMVTTPSPLTDAARALVIERALWDAFDVLEFSAAEEEER